MRYLTLALNLFCVISLKTLERVTELPYSKHIAATNKRPSGDIQMTQLDKIISEYAKLRSVDVSIIHQEIASENEHTMNQLFLLACAFEAVA